MRPEATAGFQAALCFSAACARGDGAPPRSRHEALAVALNGHVEALAGPRNMRNPDRRAQAADYVVRDLANGE
jgi:hypothetical protein